MKLAILTSLYSGNTEEQYDRFFHNVEKFNHDNVIIYIYIDEAPTPSINELLDKYLKLCNIKNYVVIQGKHNNSVYYAKRKLFFTCKEKWSTQIDFGDTFTDEFIDFCNTKLDRLKDDIYIYKFRCNLIGKYNNGFMQGENAARVEMLTSGEHNIIWGKILRTKAVQEAYSLCPKYRYKLLHGEENLMMHLLTNLPSKSIPLPAINYYDDGATSTHTIKTVNAWKNFLTFIQLFGVYDKDFIYKVCVSRFPSVAPEIRKDCEHLLRRFCNKLIELEEFFIFYTKQNMPLYQIERLAYEEGYVNLDSCLGVDYRCIWEDDDL